MFFKKKYPEWFSEINRIRPSRAKETGCFAPQSNMYFRIDGSVTSCCHNWSYKIGHYPSQNIKDIWQSDQKKILQKSLDSFDFSLGCYRCFMSIKSRNISGTAFPMCIEFELESDCNLQCIMCTRNIHELKKTKKMQENNLTEIYDTKFINELKEFIPFLKEAKFYGGEPFYIESYYKIWELILAINPACEISMQTNGTILNDRIKEILSKGRFNIGISIDSIKSDTYEFIRKGAGFEKVIENLLFFQNYCKSKKTYFGISICPIKKNMYEIPEIINYFEKLNIPVFLNTVLLPPAHALWTLSANEIEKYHSFLKESYELEEVNFTPETKKVYLSFIQLIHAWQKKALINEKEKESLFILAENVIKVKIKEKILQAGNKTNKEIKIETINSFIHELLNNIPISLHKKALINLFLLDDRLIIEIISEEEKYVADFISQY